MILLGKTITVVAATDPTRIGLTGEVVDDARETLTIRNPDGTEQSVPKNTVTFTLDGKVHDGATLRGTHAARLKK